MSHIGCKEIRIPETVTVEFTKQTVTVSGPLGNLTLKYDNIEIITKKEENQQLLIVKPNTDNSIKNIRKATMYWGTYRTLINNMIIGVSQGYTKSLELIGVGYKASVVNDDLLLKIGNSYDMSYTIPKDIKIVCPKPNAINIFGIEKQRVSQTAAEIREYRPPEPYKGKGIRYAKEIIRTKEGKKK